MKNFLKENWFKIIIAITLLWIACSFAIWVNYQTQPRNFEVKNYAK